MRGPDTTRLYSATLVVRGHGLARVEATGAQSEIGRIGTATANIDFEKTRLHRMTLRLTRVMAVLGGMVSVLVILFQGLRTGDWLAAGLAGITITMSMLPEEIPVVLTVFLTLGAWRLSKHNVLTRRAAAIETLGAATVLCTDKTGTLTQNRMAIAELWAGGQSATLSGEDAHAPDGMQALVQAGMRASQPSPVDPMEQAFHRLAQTMPPAPAAEPRARIRAAAGAPGRHPCLGQRRRPAHCRQGSAGGDRRSVPARRRAARRAARRSRTHGGAGPARVGRRRGACIRARSPKTRASLPSHSAALSGWPIRCARACRTRWPNAAAPGCAWS